MEVSKLIDKSTTELKLFMAWLIGILIGIKVENLAEWIILILFSLALWNAFASIERQIIALQKEIERLHNHK